MDRDDVDTTKLDTRYRADPFPAVASWARLRGSVRLGPAIDDWLSARHEAGDTATRAAVEQQTRAAAWDSGAVEGLYDTDDGVTRTIALQLSHWRQVARDAGRNTGHDATALLNAQLLGFDFVFDLATGLRDLTASKIRELHGVVCKPQDGYAVSTPQGRRTQPLPKGEWKRHPNHVIARSGIPFAYAPVADVQGEIQRLVDDARSPAFNVMTVDLQVSWLHYALVRIHPFADGNGRVARILASYPVWGAAGYPLVLRHDERAPYLQALASADAGDHQVFASFVARRLIRTAEDLTVAVRTEAAVTGGPDEPMARDGVTQRRQLSATAQLCNLLTAAADDIHADLRSRTGAAPPWRQVTGTTPPGPFEQVGLGIAWFVTQPAAVRSDSLHAVALNDPELDADLAIVTSTGDVRLTFGIDDLSGAKARIRPLLMTELATALARAGVDTAIIAPLSHEQG